MLSSKVPSAVGLRHKRIVAAVLSIALLASGGMVAANAAETTPRVKATFFDGLVVTSVRSFPASADVNVVATIQGGSGRATLKTGTSGSLLVAFRVPESFTGEVKITATSGETTASTTTSVGATTTTLVTSTTGTTPTTPRPSTTTTKPPSSTTSTTARPSTTSTTAAPSGNMMPVGVAGDWQLAFNDEFNGTSLDRTKWSTMDGKNQNAVTHSANNVRVADGNLILTLASNSSGAFVSSGLVDGVGLRDGYNLPVGGYAEARINFPGEGNRVYNWPAWWTVGPRWPNDGEHDIAEGWGTMTVNYHSASGAHNQGQIPGTWVNSFHTFGLHRKANSADVYYDGKLVKTYATDDPGVGHALLLIVGRGNTAVFGAGSEVKVDYVRAWE